MPPEPCSARRAGAVLLLREPQRSISSDPIPTKPARGLPAEIRVLPDFRTIQQRTPNNSEPRQALGRPEIGAQRVSFNYLNPLICVAESSTACTYGAASPGEDEDVGAQSAKITVLRHE